MVLELEGAAGGTARAGANATSAYPWGAHYITGPMKENVALLALLRELRDLPAYDARLLLLREAEQAERDGRRWGEDAA